MLTLGSPERLRLQTIQAQDLLEEAARMAVPEGASEASVTCKAHVETFRGDHIKLRQAIRNLVANALRAMRDQAEKSAVELELRADGEDIVISVSDAGPGVPAELRDKVFDPFFTNHADGTGLGLALANTIVRLHGGSIHVSPQPSRLGGACFLISIPQGSAS
ncbi:MAG TPA: ATP-binding protein [Planctomycetes bacterium]|nr:ATP-binding protein [Planctomycetota bacterium]